MFKARLGKYVYEINFGDIVWFFIFGIAFMNNCEEFSIYKSLTYTNARANFRT